MCQALSKAVGIQGQIQAETGDRDSFKEVNGLWHLLSKSWHMLKHSLLQEKWLGDMQLVRFTSEDGECGQMTGPNGL